MFSFEKDWGNCWLGTARSPQTINDLSNGDTQYGSFVTALIVVIIIVIMDNKTRTILQSKV